MVSQTEYPLIANLEKLNKDKEFSIEKLISILNEELNSTANNEIDDGIPTKIYMPTKYRWDVALAVIKSKSKSKKKQKLINIAATKAIVEYSYYTFMNLDFLEDDSYVEAFRCKLNT